jgi:cytochrome P450
LSSGKLGQLCYVTLTDSANHRYLIDIILSAGEEDVESHYRMDDVTIRDNVVSFFGAGTETTATALSWAWSQLLKHPDVKATTMVTLPCVLC